MSEFKKGEVVLLHNTSLFRVDHMDGHRVYTEEGDWHWNSDCKHIKALSANQEVQLVEKPKPPKFDIDKCDIDLRSIEVVAMDENGIWNGYRVFASAGHFSYVTTFLYEDEPSKLWRETKTFVRDILEGEK